MPPATYPPIVQSALSKMDDQQKLTFESEYAARRKKLGTMVACTIIPIHFFLYGRIGMGIFYALVLCTLVGWVWWVIELCLIGKRLNEHNAELATNLARDMKLMA